MHGKKKKKIADSILQLEWYSVPSSVLGERVPREKCA